VCWFIFFSKTSKYKGEFENIISEKIDDIFTIRFNHYDNDYIAIGTERGMVYIYHVGTGHFLPEGEIHAHAGQATPVTAVR